MAGDDDRQRVPGQGHADVARRERRQAEASGDLAVARGAPVGDQRRLPPDLALEGVPGGIQVELEAAPAAGEVLAELCDGVAERVGRLRAGARFAGAGRPEPEPDQDAVASDDGQRTDGALDPRVDEPLAHAASWKITPRASRSPRVTVAAPWRRLTRWVPRVPSAGRWRVVKARKPACTRVSTCARDCARGRCSSMTNCPPSKSAPGRLRAVTICSGKATSP